jgi:hypothetical protein
MNSRVKIDPWCIVFGILTLVFVMFLVLHPLNSVSLECISIGSLPVFILGY